jgi:two-component system, OmpR family, sensor histidine kinase KdpD
LRADQNPELAAVRRLASVLGAHVLVEEGDSMIDVITRVVADRGTTYILMGTPPSRSGWERLTKPSLVFQILRALPGVDLRIVADRTQRPGTDER